MLECFMTLAAENFGAKFVNFCCVKAFCTKDYCSDRFFTEFTWRNFVGVFPLLATAVLIFLKFWLN